ncbi:MAG: virulence RhuM family protein [Patescibacteria group bacterium]|nr:virulence RhuM family protein [Patescibacteria group bacterium]
MKDNIVIYQGESGEIELRADTKKDTIWATQAQIAELFDVDVRTVNEHVQNIFQSKELNEASTIRKFRIVQNEGVRKVKREVNCYNLDVIIAVGYRVNSKKATQFRIWATGVLRQYIISGYSLNRYKLEKSPSALFDLYNAMARIDSKGPGGKFRGKVTIKLTEDFDPRK